MTIDESSHSPDSGDVIEQPFTAADLARIERETFIEQVEYHDRITSTNDRALQIATGGQDRLPLLVLAGTQTAGRGRGENRWWGDRGGLMFSVLLAAGDERLLPYQWPQASLTVGLAVCEAVETMLSSSDVGLKWPNDVFLSQRKVCGVLVEPTRQGSGRLVLGIGINVNNSVARAPVELRDTAIAMCDVSGRQHRLVDVLIVVLQSLAERLSWIGTRDDQLLDLWRRRCLLTNRLVQVDQGTRQWTGRCLGIDQEGALLLATDQGPQRCFAGVVTRLD